MVKKEMVLYLDVGIVGTFVRFKAHSSEDNYVYLEYVPLDTFPARSKIYEKPIPKDSIHAIDPLLQIPGVIDRLIIIYTGDEGSIIKRILETDYLQTIDELKDKVKSLEMKNASLLQEVETARSGASKNIASIRNVSRAESSGSHNRPTSIFDRFNRGSSDDTEDFDQF